MHIYIYLICINLHKTNLHTQGRLMWHNFLGRFGPTHKVIKREK